MPRILITGGTGLIGQHLTDLLHSQGMDVAYLSRNPDLVRKIPAYQWDPDSQTIDTACLEGTVGIINLAGSGIADESWSAERKATILTSRTRSAALLYKLLSEYPNKVETVISASGVGYYGIESDAVKTEDAESGDDFLAEVCVAWENAIDSISYLNVRVAKIRIGVVLSMEGGALQKLARPIQWWVGAPLGSGKQIMSWIHIRDLCEMFLFILNNRELSGVFNGVGPRPVTNADFTREVAKVMQKPLFLPNIPSRVLDAVLGEMATLVLGGTRASSRKIQQAGFNFQYNELSAALMDLLH